MYLKFYNDLNSEWDIYTTANNSLYFAVASSKFITFRSKAAGMVRKQQQFIQWYFKEYTKQDGKEFRGK